MMWLRDLVVGALAVWRVSSLLTEERGPADVFVRLRAAAGVVYDEDMLEKIGYDASRLEAGVLDCLWCCSVWVAGAYGLLYAVWPGAARLVAYPLALSAGAILVQKVVTK